MYIEEGFTSIAEDAFYGATDIEYVHLPDSLRRIEDSAFYGCHVGDLVLPPNLEYIGQDAFYGALGRTLVINGKDATETKQIYEELTEKLAAE